MPFACLRNLLSPPSTFNLQPSPFNLHPSPFTLCPSLFSAYSILMSAFFDSRSTGSYPNFTMLTKLRSLKVNRPELKIEHISTLTNLTKLAFTHSTEFPFDSHFLNSHFPLLKKIDVCDPDLDRNLDFPHLESLMISDALNAEKFSLSSFPSLNALGIHNADHFPVHCIRDFTKLVPNLVVFYLFQKIFFTNFNLCPFY